MKLELRKATDGTGLVVVVDGASRRIVIPLSQKLSTEITKMLNEEKIPQPQLVLPGVRH